jgi:hypothetical protein
MADYMKYSYRMTIKAELSEFSTPTNNFQIVLKEILSLLKGMTKENNETCLPE